MTHSRQDIEKAILALCLARGVGKTICPSDAARALEQEDHTWRALLPAVREVAQGLARSGQIAIYRKGTAIPDHDVSGVIRLGLPRRL
ncbi:MAG: DUF3253 domain-containing protein [Pseudomonadota bacterium]